MDSKMKKYLAFIALVAAFTFGLSTIVIAQDEETSEAVNNTEVAVAASTEGENATAAQAEDVVKQVMADVQTAEQGTKKAQSGADKLDGMQKVNYEFAQKIGITFFDQQHFTSLIIRFVLNLIVICIIARCFYYPRSHRRDYAFIFILMSMSIFLLVNLMQGDSMNLGAAMGLFAIFGIMRFRTEAVPIREMTYLFMLIAISVVNALAHADYHPKADYWDGVGIVTIVFVNIVFILMAWLFEGTKVMSQECSKIILYDNVNLITPEKRPELIADLEKRVGVKIKRIEVGMLDFLKDSAIIRIFYHDPNDVGNSIARYGKMPKEM